MKKKKEISNLAGDETVWGHCAGFGFKRIRSYEP